MEYKFKDIVKLSEIGITKYSDGVPSKLDNYRRQWRWLVIGEGDEKDCLRLIRIDNNIKKPRTESWYIGFLEEVSQ